MSSNPERTQPQSTPDPAKPLLSTSVRARSPAASDALPIALNLQKEATKAGKTKVSKQPTVSERVLNAISLRPTGDDVEFPPAHWKEQTTSAENDSKDVAEDATDLNIHAIGAADSETDITLDQAPEPVSFATRIQAMLSSIPPVFSSAPAPNAAAASDDGSVPSMVKDPRLISFLSSPSVMNGSASRGRLSVWSALDRLKGRLPGSADEHHVPSKKMENGRESEGEPPEDDDDASVMLYGPLLPDAASEVELAESEFVHEQGKVSDADTKDNAQHRMWPFARRKSETSEESGEGRVHVRGTKDKRVWVPSETKISLEIMWWGYRLYLPPPVLDMLDNKQLEGAKRAALVTTALKWMLDRIPAQIVPPNMQPALTLLKGLVPYLSYVGGFVAWSWAYIKKFDRGNGVTLTATWLATVALVPGTWGESDFRKQPSLRASKEPEPPATEAEGKGTPQAGKARSSTQP